jgi:hypothetical protein
MTLSKLLASTRPGVYRATPAASTAAASVRTSPSGVVQIEVADARDKLAFLSALANLLGFPARFGQSWEAFYGGLTDLADRTEAGLTIVFDDLSGFARGEPEEFAAAVDALRDAVDYWNGRGKRLTVFVGLDQVALGADLPDEDAA